MAKTAVVWGHKLHTHTHSYVHEGFARAFRFLGYDVYWVDDHDDVSGIDFSGALFVTEGQVDTRIPIRHDCKYVLHNCDGARYASVRSQCLAIQVYCARNMLPTFERLGPASYFADGCLYQPWATDLLPHEIDLDTPSRPREQASYWVGTIGDGEFGNVHQIDGFRRACEERDVAFVQRASVSREMHIDLVQRSYLAPAIAGRWQLAQGYVPCRIFKNISYGQLGLTNSEAVNAIFEGRLVTCADTHQLFLDGEAALSAPGAHSRVRDLMQTVRDAHTFVQRIHTILKYFRRSEPMMTHTDAWKPQLIDGLDLCEVVDGYVVYESGTDRVHYLNNTAALVLELCTGGNAREDIVTALRSAFGLPERPDAEVNDILGRFTTEGLIR